MYQILIKEVNTFLNSLTAYVVIVVFLTTIGLLMWVFPDTSVLQYGFADMEMLFRLGPYVFMFLIPAITMRMFSEERKTGTLEILLTKPLTDYQIILGKYLASIILVIFSILPTLLYYFSLYKLGSPPGNIDTAGVTGSYVGLILLGGVFASIGLFSSALTENQVVAFIIAVFLSYILYDGFQSLALIDVWAGYTAILEKLCIANYYNNLSRGLIDLASVVYFLSIICFMILLTKLVTGSRKW